MYNNFNVFGSILSMLATVVIVFCLFLINIQDANCTTFDGVSYINGNYKSDKNNKSTEEYYLNLMIFTSESHINYSNIYYVSGYFCPVGAEVETNKAEVSMLGYYNSEYCADNTERDYYNCPRPYFDERIYGSHPNCWSDFDFSYVITSANKYMNLCQFML